ncbi:efflux RND transporter periplasmic adaptor subunit [candidate division KSB1 bacterium]|nr:efflux RND transporter periplasmic adaptor subunit [candidate division KSB1 bacterium]NIR70843.1 efflux RND transporter periplasmic adaptor subunit [candidate division KSB1 bacterium]NIS24629.1 efflux RND transporter periplasmic adaptor subunit [candidate division KSB1 bacterium]NIT71531.1 efflux RND transporter periplasmic adaptor subunit [candidate division KSB1 bacterium]NIU25229.1 efflux RND transporter periplasmic adaptor subunit [candidate division KSB1 bacterium]
MKLQNKIFILFLISTGLLLFRCSGESDGTDESRTNRLIPAVEAVRARHGSLPLTERLSGVVKARNQVEIYPEISAAIVQVHVENGDTVEEGQPLVRLRDKELWERLKQARASYQIAVAQAKQAEARLKEMQAELERTQMLSEKQLTSATELETIQTQAISAEADVELANARVEQARAIVDEREEALSQTVIRAPVTGSVGNRNAEVGMLVNSNTRLFTLGQLDSVRVEVVLTDRMLNYVETGQRTEIYAENTLSGVITSSLSRISPFLHPVTHSTEGEIDLANPGRRLKSGMFVTVDIYYGESEQATLVPLSALYENPVTGGTGVYVSQAGSEMDREPVGAMNDGQSRGAGITAPVSFEFVPVDVIAKGRMHAGIRGVEAGDWVVTIGQDLIGGESGKARVRPVKWEWVEYLQNLQRQDLLQEVMKRQQATGKDTTSKNKFPN